MQIRHCAALVLFAAVFASPALAASSGDRQGKDAKESSLNDAKDPKARKVCRVETETGSIMPKRVCRTVAESDKATADSVRSLERARESQSGFVKP